MAPPAGSTAAVPGPGALLGAYRLVSLLGQGGMGIVYLAEHTRLARRVALKLLRPELAADAGIAKRFLDEARAVNRVEHANVIDITDIIEETHRYYIMELLHGETLAARLARAGSLAVPEALDVGGQLAAALAAVHEADIIHCDVKPENVFLAAPDGGAGKVKLIDFGIARLPGDPDVLRPRRVGSAQGLIGTPAYMAPEQIENARLTHKVDVYAFGVLLYRMLTGFLPFEADTVADMVLKHLSLMPQPPGARFGPGGAIPPALDDLTLHCLAKRPEDRPTSMQEVELRLARAGEGMQLRGLAAPRRRWRWWVLGPAAAAVVALAAVGIGWVAGGDGEPGGPPGARPVAGLVEVTFDSSPRGAVVRDDAGKLLGVTPLKTPQPRSARPRRYVFELAGYAAAIRRVPLTQATRVAVTLVPLGAAPAKARETRRTGKGGKREARR